MRSYKRHFLHLNNQILIDLNQIIHRPLNVISIRLLYRFDTNTRQATLTHKGNFDREEGSCIIATHGEDYRAGTGIVGGRNRWDRPCERVGRRIEGPITRVGGDGWVGAIATNTWLGKAAYANRAITHGRGIEMTTS
jgi:hypothetical protein